MADKLCIWGSGQIGHEVATIMNRLKIHLDAVFDSDVNKTGTAFDDEHTILGIDSFGEYDGSETTVILAFGRPHYRKCKQEVLQIIKHANTISCQEYYSRIAELIYNVEKTKWDIDYSKQISNWLSEFEEELPYHFRDMECFEGKTRTPHTDIPRLKDYNLKDGEVLLDIGSGGTLKYSKSINGVELNYIPVDALSDAYKIGHEKYNFTPNEEIRFAMCEHLTRWFSEGFADYIIFDNSMDHTLNPVRSIFESYRVLKVGGVLSCKHHAIEALFGAAEGLHAWDFFITEKGDYVIAQAGTDNIANISELFSKIADVKAWEEKDEEIGTIEVCINICKREEASIELIDIYDNYRDEGILIHELMKSIVLGKIKGGKV